MKSVPINKRLSLTECKKTLNTGGVFYTDDELIEIRNWLYHIAEIAIDAVEEEEQKKLMESKMKQDEKESTIN